MGMRRARPAQIADSVLSVLGWLPVVLCSPKAGGRKGYLIHKRSAAVTSSRQVPPLPQIVGGSIP